MSEIMFNQSFLNEKFEQIKIIPKQKSHAGYVTSKKSKIHHLNSGLLFIDSRSNKIICIGTNHTGPILKVSSDQIYENEDSHIQGSEVFFPEIEGFITKKPTKILIATDNNKKLSTILVFSLGIDLIVDYKNNIQDYFEELNCQLEGLCVGIMMENDENLTLESMELKRKLHLIFEPA